MKYEISIPKPCHEDWGEMTPNEKGRFCAQCSKTVIDFRAMSTRQIVDHLAASSANTCGRFAIHQLGEKKVVKARPWAKYLAAAGIIASLSYSPLDAQLTMGKISLAPVQAPEPDCVIPPQKPAVPNSQLIIKGQIMSESGEEPLVGAAILVPGTELGTLTDEQGHFVLTLYRAEAMKSIDLLVTYIGYEARGLCIPIQQEQSQYEVDAITLREAKWELSGEVVYTPRRPLYALGQRLGRFFRRL